MGELEILPARVGWQATKRSEPMLEPFATEANPPLSDVLCERRLRLTALAADAHVVLRYADQKAAIIMRAAGEGSVLLWNFSPAREFSNLAGLSQFPILAQRAARLLAGGTGEETAFLWGQTATVAIPKAMDSAMITVRKPSSTGDEPVARALQQRVMNLRADRLGHWTVQFAEGANRLQKGFSVNCDFAESDLTPIDGEDLREVIPRDQLVIASDLKDLAERRRTVTQPLDLAVPLLLVLLVLMMGESFFANRFYRVDESQTALPQ
jgi:hypothetical protein